jgi:hypothetical protein
MCLPGFFGDGQTCTPDSESTTCDPNASCTANGCGCNDGFTGDGALCCDAGLTFCSNACVNITSDPNNCGSCGTVCSGVSPSSATCSSGECITTLSSVEDGPTGIATDGVLVYWSDMGGMVVQAIPVAGGTPIVVAGSQNEPGSLAVTGGGAFWAGAGTVTGLWFVGGVVERLASGLVSPQGLTAHGPQLYFVDGSLGTVMSVPLLGGTVTTLASGQAGPMATAIDTTNLYWADGNGPPNSGAIVAIPLAGSTIQTLASGLSAPYGIAAAGSTVFWTDSNVGSALDISSSGGSASTIDSGESLPGPMVTDGINVYWASGSAILRTPVGGGAVITLVPGQSGVANIALDQNAVYWTIPAAGVVMKASPK